MSVRNPRLIALVGILLLAAGGGVRAEEQTRKLSGSINDFTPPSIGAWEVHGQWSLKLKGESGTAEFSADLTMERSDLWVLSGGDPSARSPHTHHIIVTNGVVTPTPTGFRVDGDAVITGNGAYPPPFGASSTIEIQISGGNLIQFSNITVAFGGQAAKHFGPQPFAGVVALPK